MAVSIELNRWSATSTVTRLDDLLACFRSKEVAQTIFEIRKIAPLWWAAKKRGDAAGAKKLKAEMGRLKMSLPGVCFSAARFKPHEWTDGKGRKKGEDTWRHQEQVVMNGLFMVDLDEVDDPHGLWARLVEKGVMAWKPCFAYVTPSGYGLKIVMPCSLERGNLYQNQKAFAEAFGVGVALDDKCKDASRLSFVSRGEDIILFDPEVTSYENEEYVARWNGRYTDGSADVDLFTGAVHPTAVPGGAEVAESELGAWIRAQLDCIREHRELEVDGRIEGQDYDGIPLTTLVEAYARRKTATMKSRHDTMMTMARDLRHVAENDPKTVYYFLLRQPLVQEQVLEGRDVVRSINDALGWKYTTKMPEVLGKTIRDLLRGSADGGDSAAFSEDGVKEALTDFGERLGRMAAHYPCMPELFRMATTVRQRPAVTMAAACMLGTLATKCYYYHYWHPEQLRRLNYQVYIVALPGQGKGTIDSLNKILTAPLQDNDTPQFKLINDYKNKSRSMSNSSEKAKNKANDQTLIEKPKTTIRRFGANSTNGVMIEDMENNTVEVDGHLMHLHMYSFDSELDSVTSLNKTEYRDKQSWELKAFHNEEISQQFKNNDSITGFFAVYWNFIYTGTPTALYRKINKRNFGSGLSTRMCVVPLGTNLFDFSGYNSTPEEAKKDSSTLSMWAYRMDEARGELPLKEVVRAVYDWCMEKVEVAQAENDYETAFLIKRISYYGIHGAAPFILMRHWEEWQKEHRFRTDELDKALCLLLAELQLYTQRLYFGRFTKDYLKESAELVEEQGYDSAMERILRYYHKMPDTFVAKDIPQLFGISAGYARKIIAQLLKASLVIAEKGRVKRYVKTKGGKKA